VGPKKVIEGIRRRYRLGRPLNMKAMAEEDIALYMAGRFYMGTWKAALRAAKMNISRIYNQQKRT
jgi:hypothetical protein